MRRSPPLLAILACLCCANPLPAGAAGWSFRSGEELPGDPVAFDFERKVLTFRDPVSRAESLVPTRSLSLRSRQKLLLSPLFHQADAGRHLWTPEKRRLLALGGMVPAGVLFLGFWGAAWFFTGRRSPLLAVFGFLGSWAVLGILAICYTFLMMRFDGGLKIGLFGVAMALGVTPLYLSAVYNCSYPKGLWVLLSHLLAGFCFLSIGLAALEIGAGRKRSEEWWNRKVFEPVGLIAPDADPPRTRP